MENEETPSEVVAEGQLATKVEEPDKLVLMQGEIDVFRNDLIGLRQDVATLAESVGSLADSFDKVVPILSRVSDIESSLAAAMESPQAGHTQKSLLESLVEKFLEMPLGDSTDETPTERKERDPIDTLAREYLSALIARETGRVSTVSEVATSTAPDIIDLEAIPDDAIGSDGQLEE